MKSTIDHFDLHPTVVALIHDYYKRDSTDERKVKALQKLNELVTCITQELQTNASSLVRESEELGGIDLERMGYWILQEMKEQGKQVEGELQWESTATRVYKFQRLNHLP